MARDEALRGLAVRGLGKVGSSWEGAWLHREVLRKSLEDRKEQAGPGGGTPGGAGSQYFGDLMQRSDSLEKSLTLGNIEGRRRRGQ